MCLVHGAAALVAAAGLGWTLWHGVGDRDTALAFGILIAAGELTRRTGPGSEREPAPLGAAGALAYALLGQNGGHPTVHGAPQVVAVVVAGTLAGTAPHVPRGRGPTADQLARRVLTVAFAAACFQPLCGSGRTAAWAVRGPSYAVVLLLLLGLTALCDAVLAAAMAHARTRSPAPGARSRPTGESPSGRCSATNCAHSPASARPSAPPVW